MTMRIKLLRTASVLAINLAGLPWMANVAFADCAVSAGSGQVEDPDAGDVVTCAPGAAYTGSGIGSQQFNGLAPVTNVTVDIQAGAELNVTKTGGPGGDGAPDIFIGDNARLNIAGDLISTGKQAVSVGNLADITVSGDLISSGKEAINSGDSLTLLLAEGGLIDSSANNSSRPAISTGAEASITVGGTISSAGQAILFNGAGGRLTLLPTYAITGTVTTATGVGGYALALGGTGNGFFDVTAIDPAAQFRDVTLLSKVDASTWTLSGASAYAGPLTVAAGTLVLDGSLVNSSAVVNGGRLVVNGTIGAATVNAGLLQGTGTINGDVALASNAIVAPGNSPGTLTVGGNLGFASGSTYAVEIAANGVSDRINVGGTATLGGADVSVLTLDPELSYQNGQTYNILQAGSLVGTFAAPTIASGSAFLRPTLSYGDNAVTLTIATAVTPTSLFSTVATSPNQFSTATALDALEQTAGSAQLALYNAILFSDAETARYAFNQLSGEGHASVKTALIEESSHSRDAIGGRLRQAFGEEDLAPTAEGDGPAIDYGHGVAGWGRAFGSWGSTDGDGNAAEVDHDTGGFFVGLDGVVTDNVRLGAVAGYSRSDIDVASRAFSADVDSYTVGLYAGTELSGVSLNGGVTHTWHQVETERSVALAGFSDALSADYDAQTTQVFGEVGYKLFAADAVFEPFAGLAYVNLDADGFGESGGSAALSSGGDNTDTTYSTLGLRASTGFSLGSMNARVNGGVAWQHAYGDDVPDATLAFAGGNGFTVSGVPIAEDAALVQAGFDVDIMENATIGLTYDGQFGDGTEQHGARLDLSVKF